MIYFVRIKDIPQVLVGGAISIGFLLILVPVWIANPGLVNSSASVLVQLGFIVAISMIAASSLCKWIKQHTRSGSIAPATAEVTRKLNALPSNSSEAEHARAVLASAQSNTIERAVSTVAAPRVTYSPNTLAEEVAKLIGETFSSNHYIELFGDQRFSDDWTVQDGLAVWYFFGTMAMDIAIYSTTESAADAFAGVCDKFLSKQWHMSAAVLSRFNGVRQATAGATFSAFMECKSSADYPTYFSRCVNRILGASLPFQGSTIDLILKGHEPKTFNPALDATFGSLFVETTIAAKKLLSGANIDWPTKRKSAANDSRPRKDKPVPARPKVESPPTEAARKNPQGRPDNEYPTEEQMNEMWDAYKSGKPGSMEEVLRKRREERKAGAQGEGPGAPSL